MKDQGKFHLSREEDPRVHLPLWSPVLEKCRLCLSETQTFHKSLKFQHCNFGNKDLLHSIASHYYCLNFSKHN